MYMSLTHSTQQHTLVPARVVPKELNTPIRPTLHHLHTTCTISWTPWYPYIITAKQQTSARNTPRRIRIHCFVINTNIFTRKHPHPNIHTITTSPPPTHTHPPLHPNKNLKLVFRPHRHLRPLHSLWEKAENWKFEFYSCSGQNVLKLTQTEH